MAQRLSLFSRQPDRVISWWDALGGSDALRQALPTARIVDASPVTPSPRKTAGPWWKRWLPMDAHATQVQPDDALAAGEADMVWANGTLDKCADPAATLRAWHAALKEEGLVMFTTFGPDTLRELRPIYQQHGWGPWGAAHRDMHDIGDDLLAAGFADPVMDQELLRLTWADGDAALRELRTLGANVAIGRHPGLRTPRWRDALVRAVEASARRDGRVELSFEIVHGHAFKPKPRLRKDHAVDVDALRATLPSRHKPA